MAAIASSHNSLQFNNFIPDLYSTCPYKKKKNTKAGKNKNEVICLNI